MGIPPTSLPPAPAPVSPSLAERIGHAFSRASAFLQSALFKTIAFSVTLFLIEIGITIRYGYDTVTLALAQGHVLWIALLDAALIDALFTLLLNIGAYGGTGKRATKLRPVALLGAAVLFAGMMRIADGAARITQIAPHGALPTPEQAAEIARIAKDAVQVTQVARIVGALVLAYVASGILIDLWHRFAAWFAQWRKNRVRPSAEEWREQVWRNAYWFSLALLRLVIWIPALFLAMWHLGRDALGMLDTTEITPARIVDGRKTAPAVQPRSGTQTSPPALPAPARTRARKPRRAPAHLNGHGAHSINYEWLGDKSVRCPVCDELVNNGRAYDDRTSAGNAFSGHCKGGKHQARLRALMP